MIARESTHCTCDLLDRRLDDLLDGDTASRSAPLTRDDALGHVAECRQCRERHGALLVFLRRLQAGSEVPLPAGSRPPSRAEAPRALFGRGTVAQVAAAIVVVAAAALWWRSAEVAVGPVPTRTARESVVFAPLQRLTAIRIDRSERVLEWRPAGINRVEHRTFTAPAADAAGESPFMERVR